MNFAVEKRMAFEALTWRSFKRGRVVPTQPSSQCQWVVYILSTTTMHPHERYVQSMRVGNHLERKQGGNLPSLIVHALQYYNSCSSWKACQEALQHMLFPIAITPVAHWFIQAVAFLQVIVLWCFFPSFFDSWKIDCLESKVNAYWDKKERVLVKAMRATYVIRNYSHCLNHTACTIYMFILACKKLWDYTTNQVCIIEYGSWSSIS